MSVEIRGRAAELASIAEFIEGGSTDGGVLIVEGAVGIGKTTLIEAGRENASQLGRCVLSAHPAQAEAQWGLAALSDLFAEQDEDLAADLPAPLRAAFDVALLRARPGDEPPENRSVARAVLGVLRTLAAQKPVLIVIDDLPWLDGASAAVLSYVLRRLRSTPVGLLASARTSDVDSAPSPEVAQLIPDSAARLTLGPLAPPAIGDMLTQRLGVRFTSHTLRQVHEAAGGNPLFALEFGKDLVERREGGGRSADLELPPSLRILIGRRFGALPVDTRHMLVAAALLAEPTITSLAVTFGDRDAVFRALEPAVRREIVATDLDRLDFTHPLFRSAAIDGVAPQDLRRMHRRLVDAVSTSEEAAKHLALAADGPDERVAQLASGAAAAAAMRGAWSSAAELGELSVALTTDAAAGVQRRIDTSGYHFEARNLPRARALLQEATAAMAPGPHRVAALLRLSTVMLYSGDPISAWRACIEQADAERGSDSALRDSVLIYLVLAAANAGDSNALTRHLPAMLTANASASPAVRGTGLACAAMLEFMAGRDPTQLMNQALAAGPIDAPPEVQPELLACMLRRYADDLEGSRSAGFGLYQRLVQRAAEMEIPVIAWHLAEVEIWAGRWDEAQTYLDAGLDAATATGSPGALMLMLLPASMLHALRGDLALARDEALQLMQIAQHGEYVPAVAWALHLIAFAALSEGDLIAVDEALAPVSTALLASGVGEPGMLRFVPDHVEALIRLGRQHDAEALLAPYERRAGELQRKSALGAAARCRAMLDVATGRDPADAVATALEAHRSIGMPFEYARTLLVAGEVMRRKRRRRLADDHFHAAQDLFVGLGSPTWAARAQRERVRLGLRGSSTELSATELRIASLAAAGKSNPEIAAETFLALRTVEAHLTQVFRKLSIRSRIELPRRLTDV